MKFKVTRNIKPNMFGRINGSVTLVGKKDCPYDIEWLIAQIMSIWYVDINDAKIIKQKKKYLLESLYALEVNKGYVIKDKIGQLSMLILRVPNEVTFSDILIDELP